jgi:hypothetical protein
MRGCRYLSREILSGRMPIHVQAFRPEGALGNIVDLTLIGNVNGAPFLSVKR